MNNDKDFNDLVNELAKGSRPRPKARGRKQENVFVCKKSIDLTEEALKVIQDRIKQHGGNTRTVVYEALELLAEKHNHNN